MNHSIPTYDLNDVFQRNFLVERIENRILNSEDILLNKGVHRDSHYIFSCLEKGYVKMMVDFKIYEAREPSIFCVLPGQVHEGLIMENVSGWFVAVKADLIPDIVRAVFEESTAEIYPLPVDKNLMGRIHASVQLLHTSYTDESLNSKEGFLVIQSLLHAFVGMFAHAYQCNSNSDTHHESRALQLTRAFRTLIRKEYKTLKSPSSYAEILHISRGYLAEVVREVTGKSVQHWIHQEILIEAKRLLAFTQLTVKEVAYELGYNDPTYFSRLFSKLEGISPSEFRNSNPNR
ncbi:helix-turn-helix transcriptional regulator [Chryseobacterium sp. NRRL B-14859]|uniref:helix-turn-helix transcriptional regulator n=1 Tax=Chryseobacterium sp. NRRL B-14859 TaxID=1562763 RepID=UPI003395AD73